eukprot:scaffold68804_cov61-Phaeocystis_antarctica.AAC.2
MCTPSSNARTHRVVSKAAEVQRWRARRARRASKVARRLASWTATCSYWRSEAATSCGHPALATYDAPTRVCMPSWGSVSRGVPIQVASPAVVCPLYGAVSSARSAREPRARWKLRSAVRAVRSRDTCTPCAAACAARLAAARRGNSRSHSSALGARRRALAHACQKCGPTLLGLGLEGGHHECAWRQPTLPPLLSAAHARLGQCTARACGPRQPRPGRRRAVGRRAERGEGMGVAVVGHMPLRQLQQLLTEVTRQAGGGNQRVDGDVLDVRRARGARVAHVGHLQRCGAQREQFELRPAIGSRSVPAAVAVEINQQLHVQAVDRGGSLAIVHSTQLDPLLAGARYVPPVGRAIGRRA